MMMMVTYIYNCREIEICHKYEKVSKIEIDTHTKYILTHIHTLNKFIHIYIKILIKIYNYTSNNNIPFFIHQKIWKIDFFEFQFNWIRKDS
jgi:hypothetical protein